MRARGPLCPSPARRDHPPPHRWNDEAQEPAPLLQHPHREEVVQRGLPILARQPGARRRLHGRERPQQRPRGRALQGLLPHPREVGPRLIEEGFSRGVVLATPATLIALLRAVAYGWRQEQLNAHAEEAGRLGKDLYERMAVLADHLNDVGQALGKSVSAYNRAVGSLETRILPAARRFKELGVASEKEIPLLEPAELVPRKTLPFEGE